VLAYYTAFLLCNIFWGVALLSRLYGAKPFVSLVSGAYAVVCGLNTVIMGALDNLLFLSVFPFLIIRLQLFIRGNGAWFSIFGLALSGSAVFYAYPEGLAVAGVVFLSIFIFYFLKIPPTSLAVISFANGDLYFVGSAILDDIFWLFKESTVDCLGGRTGRSRHFVRPHLGPFLPSIFGSGRQVSGRRIQKISFCFGRGVSRIPRDLNSETKTKESFHCRWRFTG
jgi:hypothetical protein